MKKLVRAIVYRAKLRNLLSNGKYREYCANLFAYTLVSLGLWLACVVALAITAKDNGTRLDAVIFSSIIVGPAWLLVYMLDILPHYIRYRKALKESLKAYCLNYSWRHRAALSNLTTEIIKKKTDQLAPVQDQLSKLEKKYAETITGYNNYKQALDGLTEARERISGELKLYQSICDLTAEYDTEQ